MPEKIDLTSFEMKLFFTFIITLITIQPYLKSLLVKIAICVGQDARQKEYVVFTAG